MFKEGLGRFATKKYQEPSAHNLVSDYYCQGDTRQNHGQLFSH